MPMAEMSELRSKIVPLAPSRSGAERIGEALKEMIKNGNLSPGEKLPSENELALAFDVSRPVVREALSGLSMLGILRSNQGGGSFVTDLAAERLLEPLSFYFALRDYSIEELFKARQLIEGELARNAARFATQQQREHLLELARQGALLADDPPGFRILDAQFHKLIWTAAGNNFLLTVSQSLHTLAIDLRRHASEMPGVLNQSASDHQAIAEAIAAGDVEAADRAMTMHSEHVRSSTIAAARETRSAAG